LIAVLHADNGYSRRASYGSLVHNMVLIYSPDYTHAYGSRTGIWGGRIGV